MHPHRSSPPTNRLTRSPSIHRAQRPALLMAGALLTTQVEAQETRSVVTASSVQHSGLGAHERMLFDRGLSRALHRQPAATGSADADCFTEACWQSLAQAHHADLVVSYCAATDGNVGLCDPRQHVQPIPDESSTLMQLRSYRFATIIYSPVTRVVTTASAGCDACTIAEAVARLQGLTETLLQTARRPDAVGTLTLRGAPTGSLVFVDGVLRAQTDAGPLTLAMRAEQGYSLVVYAPTREPFRAAGMKIRAGEAATLDVPVLPEAKTRDIEQPEAPPPPEQGYYYPQAPSAWRWGLPLGLLGVGGLLLGLGGRALAIDGTCLASQPGCPAVYGTHDLGLGLAVAGGALVAGGLLGLAFGVQKVYVRVPAPTPTE